MPEPDEDPIWIEEYDLADRSTPGALCVIVLERATDMDWREPDAIVDTDPLSARRRLAYELAADIDNANTDTEAFLEECPAPGADASDADIAAWLTAYREAITRPWFTEMYRVPGGGPVE